MSVMSIRNVEVDGQSIICKLFVEGEAVKAFRKKKIRFYYDTNISLEGLPASIAVVPLLAQLLPIAWVLDATINVPECDEDFLNSIPEFQQGYKTMHPNLSYKGALNVERVQKNEKALEGAMCLFSCGLDAHDTALRHADEKPLLLIVRGSDVSLVNDDGWNKIVERVDSMAETLGVARVSVKSNFRHMLDYTYLDAQILSENDTWWHSMQYGIGLLSLAAPIAWQKGLSTVYIASSFTEGSQGTYKCASDPTIDNHLRFCGVQPVHDGYECSRLDKLRNVASWCRENNKHVYLRVCARRPVTGSNCCRCEKCWRTMFGLYAIGENPADYGFDALDFATAINKAHNSAHRFLRNMPTRYGPIIQAMRETYTPETVRADLRWLYDLEIDPNSEIFKWINARLFRHRNQVKSLSARIETLEDENAKLGKRCTKLENELAEIKQSIWYRIYRKTTKKNG